jgi:HAMP domain/Histidine kinase-, DNA gyrase B-, and HSP90-like ATPase
VLGRLSISQKLVAVVVAPLLVLSVLGAVGFSVFQRVKVNGPQYQKIADTKDLIADVLPPPAYLLEVHYVASQMLRGDAEQFKVYVSDVAKLEKQYNDRHAYWSKNLNDASIAKPFLTDSYSTAVEYFKVFNFEFVPQMKTAYENEWAPTEKQPDAFVLQPNEAEDTFANKLNGIYDRHRSAIDRTVELTSAKQQILESETKSQVSRSLSLLALLALLGAGLSGLLGFLVARAVRTPILQLTRAANKASQEDLPRLVRSAQTADVDAPLPTIEAVEVNSTDELGELARAFTSTQSTAVNLASEQARVRRNVSENLVNLARRNQTLLGRSLALLTDLEQNERDPEKLHELFRVDHLTTRMRRNAESLLVLAGADPARTWSEPIEVGDVVRAAVSAIESFDRVDIVGLEHAKVKGTAVSDVAHLLAELIENSTAFSAPTTRVAVIGKQRPDGYLLVITDDGIGMSPAEVDAANVRIMEFAAFDATPTKVLGLNVVGRLASRHNIEVTLAESATAGVAARIVLPASIMDGLQLMDPSMYSPESDIDGLVAPSERPTWSASTVSDGDPVEIPAIAVATEFAPSTDAGSAGLDNVRELRRGGGLIRRVRGAQMPDTGPAVEDEPVADEPDRAEGVKSSLSNLQSGMRRGRNDDGTFVAPEDTFESLDTEWTLASITSIDAENDMPTAEFAHSQLGAEHPDVDSAEFESDQFESAEFESAELERSDPNLAEASFEETSPSGAETHWASNGSGDTTNSGAATDLSDAYTSVATLEHPAIEDDQVADEVADVKTSAGLTRRVRGAQMPDTGPVVDRTLGIDSDPDHVRSALSRLQRGVASGHAANEAGDIGDGLEDL